MLLFLLNNRSIGLKDTWLVIMVRLREYWQRLSELTGTTGTDTGVHLEEGDELYLATSRMEDEARRIILTSSVFPWNILTLNTMT